MQLSKQQIEHLKRVGVVLLVALSTIGAIYAFESLKQSAVALHDDFVLNYREASMHANKMMSSARSVHSKVADINSMDLEGNSAESLQLIEEAKKDNQLAKKQAEEVVNYIGEMALEVDNIDNEKTRAQAIELLALESEIIKNFMSYNNNVNDFLASLRTAIEGSSADERRSADSSLRAANLKIDTVNRLNEVFLQKAEELNLQASPQD